MAKILTDKEMGDIVSTATRDPLEIECADAYEHFIEDLGELIATHFGGIRGNVGRPDDGMGWTCGFRVNECVPSDGGVFKNYDTDVEWKNGEEADAVVSRTRIALASPITEVCGNCGHEVDMVTVVCACPGCGEPVVACHACEDWIENRQHQCAECVSGSLFGEGKH